MARLFLFMKLVPIPPARISTCRELSNVNGRKIRSNKKENQGKNLIVQDFHSLKPLISVEFTK